MRATIISVGSEILRGTLLDTNAQFFAQELHALGADIVRTTQVKDDLPAIVATLRASCELADVVVVSGGLGPTEDDLTREALLELTGEPPTVNAEIVAGIRARFTLRGETMPVRNEKQAWEIPSASIIPNPHGTAPGWAVDYAGVTILTLPGPPRENRPMWRDYVRARLVPLLSGQAIVSRTIKSIGIGESAVADRLAHLVELGWPEVATYAKQDGVHITVTAAHADRAAADAAVRAVVEEAATALQPHVYGFGDDSLAAAIVQPLAAANAQIAIWEAGTAGAFLRLLLSDSQAQNVVADARLWARPLASASNVRDFARAATGSSGIGTAAVVIASINSSDSRVGDGGVDIALAHAGKIIDAAHHVRGTPDEIRRRAALLAAEFFWTEIKTAAGVHTAGAPSSRSSNT